MAGTSISQKQEEKVNIDNLHIMRIDTDKKRFLALLLIGDESEPMIDRYLDRGTLYVGFADESPIAVCVTSNGPDNMVEVKNLAVHPDFRRTGIGRLMLRHAEGLNPGKTIILGTGETPSTLRFYKNCGYTYSHRIPGFFTDNYPRPIVEEGVTLCDMVYLSKSV